MHTQPAWDNRKIAWHATNKNYGSDLLQNAFSTTSAHHGTHGKMVCLHITILTSNFKQTAVDIWEGIDYL
uniref:Uncharacterized protein n=1 Tax=Rhizophora mucronata TaxID=61149 RepID=A0A2P2KX44_RHIMU